MAQRLSSGIWKLLTRIGYPQPGFEPEVKGLMDGEHLVAQCYQQQKVWLPSQDSNPSTTENPVHKNL